MADHEYVRLDHCTIVGFRPGAARGLQLARAAFDQEAGWLGLTSDGVVQFHTNLPLQGQRVTISVPVAQATLLDDASPVPLRARTSLRADLGGRTLDIIFSGTKTGVTKTDRWIGRVPHVGKVAEVGLLIVREAPGAGGRARSAMQAWSEILSGELRPSDLEVVGTWPGHDRDVAPTVRTPALPGAAVEPSDWTVDLATRKRRNWFELTIAHRHREWVVRWQNNPERLTCTFPGRPDSAEPLTWRKTAEKGPGRLLTRTWWVADVELHEGLHAELVAAMSIEFGAQPSDLRICVNGQAIFARGAEPPTAFIAGTL